MRRIVACVLLFLIILSARSQFYESFSDGDLVADPVWMGNTTDWAVVANSDVSIGAAGSNTLRLAVATGSGTTYISTQIPGSWGTSQSWGFFIGRRAQAFTAANHLLIWLYASEPDLLSPTIDGYRIRIGDDSGGDNITLQKLTDGVVTEVISGTAITNGLTDIGFLLRVTRAPGGSWQIFTSTLPVANGTGAVATDIPDATGASILQGTGTDNSLSDFTNGYIGFANSFGSTTNARSAQEIDQVNISFNTDVLPVTISRFRADAKSSSVCLTWNAENEVDIFQYDIERSDGIAGFKRIASVPATQRRLYQYIDEMTFETNYYRLRIVDRDGVEVVSPTVMVKADLPTAWSCWPNPVRDKLTISVPASAHPRAFELRNAEGVLLKSVTLASNTRFSKLDMSALPRGLYYILVRSGVSSQIRKVIKE